ncbi:MAG: peptide ABC transporter substrate-binding protein [Chloroflexi bacterium]|nr:peptide ABC transporter substrate-binding protein [Chloroflexota bacterium]
MTFRKRSVSGNLVLFLTLVLSTVLFLAACSKEESTPVPSPTPKPPVVLHLNLGTEPPTLDPALSVDNVSIDLAGSLFVGLTKVDEATSAILPDLATRWDVSADGTKYTFHLRTDVKWSDGKPVTAYDVEYGILRTLAPATASEYSYVAATIIKGAADFNAGKTTDPLTVGVRALDAGTLEIELEHAAGYFPGIASMWVLYPQPRWAIEAYGTKWIEPENIVTSGPFKLEGWTHDQSLVLVKNPDYYNASKVEIDRIEFVIVNEASTAMAMYEAGQLDSLYQTGVPLEDLDRVRADSKLSKELYIAPELTTYYYGFDNKEAPFDKPLVRKAFSAAIDRQSLITNVLKGGQKPARTFTAPGNFGAVDAEKENIGIKFDTVQAKAWLAEAGYPNCQGLPSVTLMYNTSEGHKKIAEAIQAMWKQHLNCDVSVVNQEWAVYLKTLQTDPPQIYRLGWGADYPDANNWLNEVFHSTSASNYARYENAQFDGLVEQAAREQDPTKRLDLYKQAERLFTEVDAGIAPIYFYTTVQLTKPYLQRTYSPFGSERFENWKVVR